MQAQQHKRPYYTREPTRVAVITTAGADGHKHVASFDNDGNGHTTEARDGHSHEVRGCDVLPCNGHRHELTEVRAKRRSCAP